MSAVDGPLVWVDCEMTGLNFRTDRLLEIAVCSSVHFIMTESSSKFIQVIITNGNLEPVDEGIDYVIHTEKPILDRYIIPICFYFPD